MAQMGVTATPQYIMNSSFDPDFGVQTFEMLAYDPLTDAGSGAMKRVTVNSLGEYITNDTTDTTLNTYYVGKEDSSGDWYIMKIVKSSGYSIRYATVKNNATKTSYTTAWADYSNLTYQTYGAAF